MRKSTNLSKVMTFFLLVIMGTLAIGRKIFVWKKQRIENILYKSEDLIVQKLKEGKLDKKVLLVLGNGWNVSVDENNKVTQHDPFFLIPKEEAKLLETKGYEIITAYFPFECSGLEQSGKELANFINTNYSGYKVILIGHSKSGDCFANLSKWLEADGEDSIVITISTPYGGVKSDKENLQKLNSFQQCLYHKIIISHRVNDDVTKASTFHEKVADYSGLKTRNFYVIKSLAPEKSYNPITLFLMWVNTKLKINGDGVVGIAEQTPPVLPKEQFLLRATHQASMQEGIKLLLRKGIL